MSCTWIYLVGFLRPTPYVNQICGHLKGLIPPNTPCSWAEEEEAEGAAGKQQQNAVKTSPVLMTDRPRADELAVNTLITQTKVKQSWAEPSWGELSRAGVGGGPRPTGVWLWTWRWAGGRSRASVECALWAPGLIRDAERFWLTSPVSFLYLA